jgi:hypothetical protein
MDKVQKHNSFNAYHTVLRAHHRRHAISNYAQIVPNCAAEDYKVMPE